MTALCFFDVLVLAVLVFAAIEDVRGMHVRNVFPALLLAVGVVRAVVTRPALPLAVVSPVLMFSVLYVFWYLGGIGGADVKILTALAVGNPLGVWVALLVACGCFIIYALLSRKTREAVPFVPAILAGVLLQIVLLGGGGF